jgi:glycine cleavage system H protein
MDGYSYYNIFETKGIEYLLIIAFLLLLVPFSILLNRKVKISQKIREVTNFLTSGILKVPQGIFYNQNHTWAHLAKTGVADVGVDDLLLHLTGEVKLTYLKNPGDYIAKGEAMTEVEHQGKRLKIFSPISGAVTASNPVLAENPGLINADPYNKGWIYKIKPDNWKAEMNSCYLADDASDWSKREMERFRDFLATTMPKYSPDAAMIAMQDGGELRDHVLSELPGELWQDFQKEFLNPS